jgi:putative transcriptional regulator
MTRQKSKNIGPQKRSLFTELAEGFNALADERAGKRTLRTHRVQFRSPPDVQPEDLIRLREQLNMSRAVFAAYLRTRVRTLESWEQGRSRPNAQAALLVSLVKKYPDTVKRLDLQPHDLVIPLAHHPGHAIPEPEVSGEPANAPSTSAKKKMNGVYDGHDGSNAGWF